jgi:hypothetical protein
MQRTQVSKVFNTVKLAGMAASLFVLVLAPRVQAVPITIQNYSFEQPTTPPGQTWFDGPITNWTPSPAGLHTYVETNASVGFSGGDAVQYAGIADNASPGGYIYQDLGVPFAPLTTYKIDIASAHRSGYGHATANFGLFSSNAIGTDIGTPGFADIQGVWTGSGNPDADNQFNQLRDASVLQTIDINGDGVGSLGHVYSFTTGAVAPTGNLVAFIRHQNNGGRINVDNIRLDATAVPEPASMVLLASCVVALVAVRRYR